MITNEERYAQFTNRDQLLGMEFMCALFSTSPRMHKPQMEIIKAQHAAINRRLDALDDSADDGYGLAQNGVDSIRSVSHLREVQARTVEGAMIDYTKVPHQLDLADGGLRCISCFLTLDPVTLKGPPLMAWLHDPKNRGEENLARIVAEIRQLVVGWKAADRITALVGGTEVSP